MKRNAGKYDEVKILPPGAKSVSIYAEENKVSVSMIYKRWERGKANFKIVIFQTVNYIINENT